MANGGLWKKISKGINWFGGEYQSLMRSNEAINKIFSAPGRNEFAQRGLHGVYKAISGEGSNVGLGQAFKHAFTKDTIDAAGKTVFKKGTKEAVRSLDVATIAGSYLGVSTGARIISGGGLTRDREGNPNIIGIPFV